MVSVIVMALPTFRTGGITCVFPITSIMVQIIPLLGISPTEKFATVLTSAMTSTFVWCCCVCKSRVAWTTLMTPFDQFGPCKWKFYHSKTVKPKHYGLNISYFYLYYILYIVLLYLSYMFLHCIPRYNRMTCGYTFDHNHCHFCTFLKSD